MRDRRDFAVIGDGRVMILPMSTAQPPSTMGIYLLKRILQGAPILDRYLDHFICHHPIASGDYLTTYVNNLRSQGDMIGDEQVKALEAQYGLDQPMSRSILEVDQQLRPRRDGPVVLLEQARE